MRVYRIEKQGWGPYSAPSRCESLVEMLYEYYTFNKKQHPKPNEDGIEGWTEGRHIFGFANRRDLVRWFPYHIRRTLHKHGFALAVYEVEDEHVKRGGKQVAWAIAHGRLMERHDIGGRR